jgi:hypothetical protein
MVTDYSSRAALGMKCFRPLKHWNRGFESHSGRVCVCVYSVSVALCR